MNKGWIDQAVGLLLGAFIAAVVVFGVYWVMGYGKTKEQLNQATAENTALAAANKRIQTLERQARVQDESHALALQAVSNQFQKDLQHEKNTFERTVAGIRAGSVRLHAPVAACPAGGGNAAEKAGTSPGRRDAEARAELSGEAAEFLVTLANDADTVVHQLTACQAIVAADRVHINAKTD